LSLRKVNEMEIRSTRARESNKSKEQARLSKLDVGLWFSLGVFITLTWKLVRYFLDFLQKPRHFPPRLTEMDCW